MLWRVLVACIAVVSLAIASFCLYVADYNHASDAAQAAAQSDSVVEVDYLEGGDIAFLAPNARYGIILYPGAKVESEAYAPLARALAERGISCVIVQMPFHLAILDPNAADGIASQLPSVQHWYIGGHSLGGTMAAQYAAAHEGDVDGLVLFASYPAADLSASALRVLSVRGSNDGVLHYEKYVQAQTKLPTGWVEYVIDGGNHAQFGSYGKQAGDNEASISNEDQIAQAADVTAAFMLR